MNGEGTRYHGEIKVTIGNNEARINVFSDNLQQLFADLGTVHAQWGKPDLATNPAAREIINAEGIARRRQPKPPADAGDRRITGRAGEIPVCSECGTADYMELIQFKDKKTGVPRQAWKCQQCQTWHWENGQGRGH